MRQRIPPAPPAAEVDRFIERCLEAFEASRARVPPEVRHLSIARRTVSISFSSPSVADRYRPATSGAEVPPGVGRAGAPDLEIVCWDTESTGVDLPPMPWTGDNLLHRDRVRGHATGDIRATFQQSEGFLQLYDGRRSLGVLHATTPAAVQPWTDRAPFRAFIGWWATDRSMAMMHASCVATDRGAALVAGSSGAGKSTTAITCALAGFQFLCDDACIVELDADGGPRVHAVYERAKLESDAALRLGFEPASDGDSLVLELPSIVREAPVRVLLVPKIVDADVSRIEPIVRIYVMRTLVPGSIREGGGLGGRVLHEMTRVVKELPCYRLLLGRDPSGVRDAVRDAIEAT